MQRIFVPVRINEEFDERTCDDETNSRGRTERRCSQDGRVIRIKKLEVGIDYFF